MLHMAACSLSEAGRPMLAMASSSCSVRSVAGREVLLASLSCLCARFAINDAPVAMSAYHIR